MNHIRFSISSLLLVILFVAVSFAALKESSDLWESGVFTLTLAALLISILLAVHRSGSRRAFWIGFALFGWTYLGLSTVPSIESRLITTKALTYLDSKVPGRSSGVFMIHLAGTGSGSPSNQAQGIAFTAVGNQLATSRQAVVRVWDAGTGRLLGGWSGTTENFIRIGHSLFAQLSGWIGGLLSRRLCRSLRSPEPSTAVGEELLRDRHLSPSRQLPSHSFSHLYPYAWKLVDEFRASRKELGDWPDWCFLPLAGTYATVSKGTTLPETSRSIPPQSHATRRVCSPSSRKGLRRLLPFN